MRNFIITTILLSFTLIHASKSENNSTTKENNITKDIVVIQKPTHFGEYPSMPKISKFDAYLSVIDIDTKANRNLILPSVKTPDTYIKKDENFTLLNIENISQNFDKGLHYIMVILTQKRVIYAMQTKEYKNFDALKDDKYFDNILKGVQEGRYGKFVFRILPFYKK